MSQRTKYLALLGVALPALFLAQRCTSPAGPRVTYTFDLRRAASGTVEVLLEVEGFDGPELLLESPAGPLLTTRASLRALGPGDTDVACRRIRLPDPQVPGQTFSAWSIEHPPRRLRLHYQVPLIDGTAGDGSFDLRHRTWAGPEGLTLSLANLVLVPHANLREVRLETLLPPGWDSLRDLPQRLRLGRGDGWWREAIIAAPTASRRHSLTPRVSLVGPTETAPHVLARLRALVEGLEAWLGEPPRELELVQLPSADDGLLVDPPLAAEWAAVDLQSLDVGAARRVVRRLVPTWFGRTPQELELRPRPGDWLLLGLSEYLARRLPVDLGWVDRDWASGLESTWMGSPNLRAAALLSAAPPPEPERRLRRRLASAVLVLELDRALEPHGGLQGLLHACDGKGVPRLDPADPRARLLQDFADRFLAGHAARLSFEDDWDMLPGEELQPPDGLAVAGSLEVVFSHGLDGYLEGCLCKVSRDGAMARRVAEYREIRAADSSALFLDLGRACPTDARRASLLPEDQHRFDVFLGFLGEDYLGLDAVVLAPDDAYAGITEPPRGRLTGVPWVACGMEAEGARIPSYVVLDRGDLRIAFVGFSEHLETALVHEIHERHMLGVHFPTDLEAVRRTLREVRPVVDLVIVGGSFRPGTARALCEPSLGVDLLLWGAHSSSASLLLGRVEKTLVARDVMGSKGYERLKLSLSETGQILGADLEPIKLAPSGSSAWDVSELVSGLPPSPREGPGSTGL